MTIELQDLRWQLQQRNIGACGKPAQTLDIRQSTLSRGLRHLEHHLDAVLFERTNCGARPTIEGQELLEAAKRIVEQTEAIAARLKTSSRGESGRMTIGEHASLFGWQFSRVLYFFDDRVASAASGWAI